MAIAAIERVRQTARQGNANDAIRIVLQARSRGVVQGTRFTGDAGHAAGEGAGELHRAQRLKDDFSDPGFRETGRAPFSRGAGSQNDGQAGNARLQHCCVLETGRHVVLMGAQQRSVEAGGLGVTGVPRFGRLREASGLVAERGENLLVPEQPPAIDFEHQDDLSIPTYCGIRSFESRRLGTGRVCR
jgi:hypothetical protein